MSTLESELTARGLTVANVDYPSRELPIESLAPMAVDDGLAECRKHQPQRIHFVTHSLGGILVRYYLSKSEIPELGRVVMLGPPNQGSEVVDTFSDLPGYGRINGPSGFQLGTGADSVPIAIGPVTYPVGIIAGTESVNPILSTTFDETNDGKVSVSRTKVEGMSDFIEVESSHPFLMRNPEAIRQTIEFLLHGRFAHDAP